MNQNEQRALKAAADTWRFDSHRELQLQEAERDPGLFGRLSALERAALARYRDGKRASELLGQSDSDVNLTNLRQKAESFTLNLDYETLIKEIAVNPARRFEIDAMRALALARYQEGRAAAVQLGLIAEPNKLEVK